MARYPLQQGQGYGVSHWVLPDRCERGWAIIETRLDFSESMPKATDRIGAGGGLALTNY
jgi:hypothetical protein